MRIPAVILRRDFHPGHGSLSICDLARIGIGPDMLSTKSLTHVRLEMHKSRNRFIRLLSIRSRPFYTALELITDAAIFRCAAFHLLFMTRSP